MSPQLLSTRNHEFQDYIGIFYKPHTLITLLIFVIILGLAANSNFLEQMARAMYLNSEEVKQKNEDKFQHRGAILGTCIAFIFVGMIHLPNTVMTRPHVVFWRGILAVSLLYVMFLTYLLLLPVQTAREALRIFDDDLGYKLPERSYAEDCRIFTPEHPTSMIANVSDAVFDVHFVSHFLGWWAKMIVVRDWYIMWISSILFEIIEITFRHWLPNFWECWWDHLFCDVFGCNFAGIVMGSITLKYFGSNKITWVFDPDYKGTREGKHNACAGTIASFFEKLCPSYFEKYQWAGLASLKRLFGASTIVLINVCIDTNNFFMKYVLWVPAEHDILKFRLVLWGFLTLAAIKEWYEFITNPYCHRAGPFSWLTFYGMFVEILITIKFQGDSFTAPFPWYVKVIWTCIVAVYLWLISIAYTNWRKDCEKKAKSDFDPYNPDLDIVEHHGKKD